MGKLVKKVAAENGLNATTLSALLDNRPKPSGITRIFRKPFFHTILLFRLRRVLDYDFFAHLCHCSKEPPVETASYELQNWKKRMRRCGRRMGCWKGWLACWKRRNKGSRYTIRSAFPRRHLLIYFANINSMIDEIINFDRLINFATIGDNSNKGLKQ